MLVRLLKLLISLAVLCVDEARAVFKRVLGRPRDTRCVVLYYHAIRDELAQQFSAQMDELGRLSVPIDIEGRDPLSPGLRYSAVTFDDGFVSVVRNALPALRARGIPCTIFVPTGSLGRRPAWLGPTDADGAEEVFSADRMREIVRQPLVRIASHSVSHPDFRSLDDEQARNELSASKATLEQIVGGRVTSFSFPHGAHTQRSLDLVRECGYARAFTIEPVQLEDPRHGFVVGRVRVEPNDWLLEFRLKVLGAYRWMVGASKIKRRLFRVMGRGGTRAPRRLQGL